MVISAHNNVQPVKSTTDLDVYVLKVPFGTAIHVFLNNNVHQGRYGTVINVFLKANVHLELYGMVEFVLFKVEIVLQPISGMELIASLSTTNAHKEQHGMDQDVSQQMWQNSVLH